MSLVYVSLLVSITWNNSSFVLMNVSDRRMREQRTDYKRHTRKNLISRQTVCSLFFFQCFILFYFLFLIFLVWDVVFLCCDEGKIKNHTYLDIYFLSWCFCLTFCLFVFSFLFFSYFALFYLSTFDTLLFL